MSGPVTGSDEQLPQEVAAALWSYDTGKLDLVVHRDRIITNVLNRGTASAWDWLFRTYPREQIIALVQKPLPGEWHPKSLNFWAIVFGVVPNLKPRF